MGTRPDAARRSPSRMVRAVRRHVVPYRKARNRAVGELLRFLIGFADICHSPSSHGGVRACAQRRASGVAPANAVGGRPEEVRSVRMPRSRSGSAEPVEEALRRYRPQVPRRVPRLIPEEWFDALFAKLGSHRDRVMVVLWVSSGAPLSRWVCAGRTPAYPGSAGRLVDDEGFAQWPSQWCPGVAGASGPFLGCRAGTETDAHLGYLRCFGPPTTAVPNPARHRTAKTPAQSRRRPPPDADSALR